MFFFGCDFESLISEKKNLFTNEKRKNFHFIDGRTNEQKKGKSFFKIFMSSGNDKRKWVRFQWNYKSEH